MNPSYAIKLISSLALCVQLFGCATSEKIQVVQPGDPDLSCKGIRDLMTKLDVSQADIDSKKGVNSTNVAAAIFWVPGLVYTYYDAGEAQRLIRDRKSALTTIYNNKRCVA